MNVRCQARKNFCIFLEHGFQKSAQDFSEVLDAAAVTLAYAPARVEVIAVS
jgi:hypothetical protein